MRYSASGDLVLDQFVGGSTTLIEAKLLNRNIIGTNVFPKADFICTHPPYANIIKYSINIKADMSHLNESDFLLAMSQVAEESFRVLKKHKYCAILRGDIQKKVM